MKIDAHKFRVSENKAVALKKWPTKIRPFYRSKEHYKMLLETHIQDLSTQQGLLYADGRRSLLLIFQAMDAAGKDGAIKHVMSGVNPQGCQVFSFKQPGPIELAHDFLWRTTCCLPTRGHIGIFNRSYYEEVLVARVHPEILRAQNLPADAIASPKFWQHRFRSINDLEKHLYRNGTNVVKFFLHLSKSEQRRRFLQRIDAPEKNWKFSQADIKERKFWPAYMRAYGDCLAATSTGHAPWFVIPADDKENARLLISQIVVDTLRSFKMNYPVTGKVRRKELLAIRKSLAK